jgi:arsenite/tail-anchored protein-transporting ATPase
VVNPEKMVIAEARRTYTYLSLFGYRVDAVVVNRIIPDEVEDPYFGKWKDIQAEHLASVHESFQPIPILTARLFDREMVGSPLLGELAAEIYGDTDVTAILHQEDPLRVRKIAGVYVLSIRLPFVERTGLNVFRKSDELFVRIGSYKRNVILPQVLQRLEIQEAAFVDDRLEVRFAQADAGQSPAGPDEEGAEASG